MAQLNNEPSMEDILASIKRIIAEDSEATGPRPARPIRREMASVPAEPIAPVAAARTEPVTPVVEATPEIEAVSEVAAAPEIDAEVGDVLELTSPLTEDAPPPPVQQQPSVQAPSARPQFAQTLSEQLKPAPAKPIRSKPIRPESVQSEPIQLPKEPIVDRLMSDPAAEASRNAFAALAQLQVRADSGQENTLEGLVADLLRPMLREWLDRELPSMVERMVAAEIGRVSNGG